MCVLEMVALEHDSIHQPSEPKNIFEGTPFFEDAALRQQKKKNVLCAQRHIQYDDFHCMFKIQSGNFVKETQHSTSRHYDDAASRMFQVQSDRVSRSKHSAQTSL
jgi:hypothetical protein